MTNLHRSPPMNQSKTDLGIVNESQLLRFGISEATEMSSLADHIDYGKVCAAITPSHPKLADDLERFTD
jgi:hypothetical protein